jgi:DNA repair exonuclease SbcCD ATPase subunit
MKTNYKTVISSVVITALVCTIGFFNYFNRKESRNKSPAKQQRTEILEEKVREKPFIPGTEPNKPDEKAKKRGDYVSLLEDYNFALKQLNDSLAKQKDLSGQLDELKKTWAALDKEKTELQGKHTKTLEDYAANVKKAEALEKKCQDLTSQYEQLNKEGLKLAKERESLENEKTTLLEKYAKSLEASNRLMRESRAALPIREKNSGLEVC